MYWFDFSHPVVAAAAVWPLQQHPRMKPDLLLFLDFLFRKPERPVSAEAPLWLIASLKSHKAVLTLAGCQSITARPLLTLAETSRGLRSGGWGVGTEGSGRKRRGGQGGSGKRKKKIVKPSCRLPS